MSPQPQQSETFDVPAPFDTPSAMTLAAQEAYQPMTQRPLGCALQPTTERMGDDALDRFFRTSLDFNVYQRNEKSDTYRAIRDGDADITLTSTRLQDAVNKIDRGDIKGAMKDINESLRLSGRGVNSWSKSMVGDTGGSPLTEAYSKDAIGDGIKEIREGRKEMRIALRTLRHGDSGEAKEALEEALRDFGSGQSQARDGADCKTGISSVDNPYSRHLNASGESMRGAEHLERSRGSLSKALESLDSSDSQGAIRDLKRSKGQLNFGVNDYKDGLQLGDNQANGGNGKQDGLRSALSNNWSIDFAIDLIKRGCPEDAKRVIRDCMKNLENSRTHIAGGPGLHNGEFDHKNVIQPPEFPTEKTSHSDVSIRCNDDSAKHALPVGEVESGVQDRVYSGDCSGGLRLDGPRQLRVTATNEPARDLLSNRQWSQVDGSGNQVDGSVSGDLLNALIDVKLPMPHDSLGLPNPTKLIDNLTKPGDVLNALPPMPHEVLGLPNPAQLIDSLPKPGDVLNALPPMPHEVLGLPNPAKVIDGLANGDVLTALPPMPHEVLGLPHPADLIDTLPKPGDLFDQLRPPLPHELIGLPGPHELLGLPSPEQVIKKVLNAPLNLVKKVLRWF